MKQKLLFFLLTIFYQIVGSAQPATHLNFDGSNDFVNIGNVIPSSSSYTKEAMIFTNNITGSNILSSSTSAFWFWQGNLQAGHGGGFIDVLANASSLINSWNHVAVTYDSPTTTMKLYINGVLVSQNTSVGQYSAANIQIGAFNSGSVFNGNIDDVRIWNVARTAEQISGSMNCELQGTETGLIAYYKFNQGFNQADNTAITALTATTGSDGTLVNFALNGTTSNWLSGSPITTGSLVPSVASVVSPVNYAQGDTASALTATVGANGSSLSWYTTATGGTGSATAPTPSTASVGSTSYWVSSTNANGCESERAEIVVNVNLPATHLNFDGVDDLVNCGTSLNTVLDPLNTITVEAWVRPSTNTGLGVIIGNYANSNQTSMQFLLRRDSNSYSFWMQGTGTFKNVIATNSVIVNTWQHVVGVWNGADLKIYVDGVLAGTTTGVNDSSFATTTNVMMIGNNQAGTGAERFTGSIDEVRIWSTAKTIEQLNGSKNCELQGSESGLIAYYNFNQGLDASNNASITTLNAITGPNGTLTNFTLNGTTSNWLAGSPVTTGSIVPSVASVTTPVVYTQGDTASALTATAGTNGTGLLWYTTATGGVGSAIAPTPSTATVGNTSYWVSSTNANGCESARVEIVVTVNAPLPATHLNFDGVDDVVDLGSALTTYFTGKTKVTIQAWVRSETNSGLGTIVGNYNYPTNNNSMQMMLRRDGANYAFWLDSGSGYTSVSAMGSVVLNTWQHVTGTWDGTTMRIYVDGVLANSSAKTGVIPSRTTSFSIGSNTSERFDGDIDEVRLWDKALTATDIMNTMNCEAQTQPELVAYYKFNQGFDAINNVGITTATDDSGNVNNGTLTNFTLNGTISNWKLGSTITSGSTCTTLSNSDFENVTSMNIYPNPSTGIFNIDVQENISVEIYDILGKSVANQKLTIGSNSIDISNLQSGIYVLKVINSKGINKSFKLIKK
jgi:hypothetical protein